MPSKFWAHAGFLLILVVGVAVLATPSAGQVPLSRNQRPWPATDFRPGRLILIPKVGREPELGRLHGSHGVRIHKNYPQLARLQVIELPPGTDTFAAIETYQRSGLVDLVEPDITIRLDAMPDDPSFVNGDQWPLHNTGLIGGVTDADIDAPEAWERFRIATNVIVAVIDSGVRYTHQDLAANMWVNPGEIPGNGIDDDGNGYIDDVHGINAVANSGQPLDEIGHGSHVAGIIGAVGNNGVGICGVAWKARIMACRFLNPGQLGVVSDLVECLNYAQNNGAKVMNCSFTTSVFSSGLSNAFWALREAGLVIAAAAGNEGTDNDSFPIYPASFKIDNIISVTATTKADSLSGYNYGVHTVHLGAPGSSIWSTYYRADDDYAFESGTSMAAPHVTGALTLMRARYPQLSVAQIITRLLGSVDRLPSLNGRCTTGGRLNLNLAVGAPDYAMGSAGFAWVPTNGMSRLDLGNDDVSAPLPLQFGFPFYGHSQSAAYVSANGIVGFDNAGLNQPAETTLPSAATPNGAIYPYWDDLNPGGGGQVWAGTLGVTPNRKFIVSWVAVPHTITVGGETTFSFQVVLHETGEIAYQYLDVQNGKSTLNSGRGATIGIEDGYGQIATLYSFHGSPSVLTNNQAIIIAPEGNALVGPSLRINGISNNVISLTMFGQPGHRCVLSHSSDLQTWVPLQTNNVPGSGIIETSRSVNGTVRFYNARLDP